MSRKKIELSKNSFGERLKYLRLKRNLTIDQVAKDTGVKKSTLSELENDKYNPSSIALIRLSDYFDVNGTWFLTGKGDEIREAKQIPIIGTVPAGFPEMSPEEDQIIDYLYLPDAPKQAFATIVKGESMSPTVRDGDYALFIKAGTFDVKNGDLIIARNEWNELLLKRYRSKDNQILLTSDNPEYKPITPNEHYKIVGKVIRIVRDIKF